MTKNTKKGTKQDGTIGKSTNKNDTISKNFEHVQPYQAGNGTTGGMGSPLKKEVLGGRDVGSESQ